MYIVSYTKFLEITIYPDQIKYYILCYKVIQSHLDCDFSKIQILLINSNPLNILVICKRTFPKEKTCIIDMCYVIYVKNKKVHFMIQYMPTSNFKLHRTRKSCRTYEFFFRAKTALDTLVTHSSFYAKLVGQLYFVIKQRKIHTQKIKTTQLKMVNR